MKRIILSMLLCAALGAQQLANAGVPDDESIKIELGVDEVPEKKDPGTRSLPISLAEAYLYNRIVNIFFYGVNNASAKVEVLHLQTGITVYAKEVSTDDTFVLDLSNYQKGEYKLIVKVDGKTLGGKFALK